MISDIVSIQSASKSPDHPNIPGNNVYEGSGMVWHTVRRLFIWIFMCSVDVMLSFTCFVVFDLYSRFTRPISTFFVRFMYIPFSSRIFSMNIFCISSFLYNWSLAYIYKIIWWNDQKIACLIIWTFKHMPTIDCRFHFTRKHLKGYDVLKLFIIFF